MKTNKLSVTNILITLIYFTLFYRQITGKETLQPAANYPNQTTSPAVNEPDSQLKDVYAEIENFQKKIDEAKNLIRQEKNLQQNQVNNIVSQINGLIARIEQLDPKDIKQVDAPLNSVIKELETIKKLQSD